jgi:D-alanyl-D-alanine carboxypeptidase
VRQFAPVLLVLLLLVVVAACGDAAEPASPPTTTAPAVDAEALQADLDRWVADELARFPELPGEIVLVDAPGVHVVTAQGSADGFDGSEPLTAEHDFRIASVTKTFVSATVLRLAEEGEVGLDDPIADHLPATFVDLLEADGYDTEAITVVMLIGHAGGFYDYAFDDDYVTTAVADLQHRWTPEEQVRFAMDHGDPLFAPGADYEYSDTAYVLAGQVIESVTGQPLAEAVRSTLDFEGLGLDHTFWETLEPAPDPEPPRFHNVFAQLDMFDSDPSTDLYGGGGLVSTVDDLATFYGALFGGEVFDDPASLARMTAVDPHSEDGGGLGIFQVDAAGVTCFEHTGFYGTVAFHCPDEDLTIIREVGQALRPPPFDFADLNERLVGTLT